MQDFSAGEAVAFVFLLKGVIREAPDGESALCAGELATLEDRIDQLALLAFDIFMRCREQICRIREQEARRMMFLPERLRQRRAAQAGE